MHTPETPIHQPLEQTVPRKRAKKTGPAAPKRAPYRWRNLRTKICRSCGEEKALLAFHRASEGPEKHSADCRRCTLAAKRGRNLAAPEGSKQCRHCREVRPMRSFAEDSRCRDGRASICQDCQRAVRAERVDEAPASLETRDELLGSNTAEKELRTALGIAIAHATCPPGHHRTRFEIAAYAEVSPEAIRRIELQALEKVRRQIERVLEGTDYSLGEVLR